MTSLYVVRRKTTRGISYHVRMEHGRGKVEHLGSYPTDKLAQARIRGAREQLAKGEIPERAPKPAPPPPAAKTIGEWADEWLDTRIDVADNTRKHFVQSITVIKRRWPKTDPATITIPDIQDWVTNHQREDGKVALPGTIDLRMMALAQILDYADVEPNPARSRKIRKPRRARKGKRMPTTAELALMYAVLPARFHGPMRMMEHGGTRVSGAISVTWGAWDRPRKRVLINEKTRAGERWVAQINGLPEMPKRPEGVRDTDRVWPGITDDALRGALRKACVDAGIPHFSPHGLRHRHASILLRDGWSAPDVAARLGHASAQITLSVYAHVVPPE